MAVVVVFVVVVVVVADLTLRRQQCSFSGAVAGCRLMLAGVCATTAATNAPRRQVVGVFSDPWVHIGGDEVPLNVTGCTVETVQLVETAAQERLITTHGRTPMGWVGGAHAAIVG